MDISEREFKKLSATDQNLVIFQNVNAVAKSLGGIKFHQKVQYVLISGTIAILGVLANVVIKYRLGG